MLDLVGRHDLKAVPGLFDSYIFAEAEAEAVDGVDLFGRGHLIADPDHRAALRCSRRHWSRFSRRTATPPRSWPGTS